MPLPFFNLEDVLYSFICIYFLMIIQKFENIGQNPIFIDFTMNSSLYIKKHSFLILWKKSF